jgi:hypothetical protein
VALQRLQHRGVDVTTIEAWIFRWIQDAKHPDFRTISRLVVQAGLAR